MIFLSSPYSKHPELGYSTAKFAAAELIRQGHCVVSPIVHCHVIASEYNLPTDAEWWWAYNRRLMLASTYMLVLSTDWTGDSQGVSMEVRWWADNKPTPHKTLTLSEIINGDYHPNR